MIEFVIVTSMRAQHTTRLTKLRRSPPTTFRHNFVAGLAALPVLLLLPLPLALSLPLLMLLDHVT